ncbi:MAG: 1-deoxy-D-xylulose-5-phosphate reductoisomerase [Armatimonadaceae bacterium]
MSDTVLPSETLPFSSPRSLVILGSTGSIGTQTVDVVRRLGPERARIVGIAARQNAPALAEQALSLSVPHVAAIAESAATELRSLLNPASFQVYSGADSLVELASLPEADTVVVAVAGAAALQATLAACRLGKRICLATKEVLVAAGELVMATARTHGAEILPIDSEHSALFQCVQGYRADQIERLWLTASGGPFRTWSAEKIAAATVADALNHPTWRMGGKITVDSATLMNKGLEMIEAQWLFDVPMSRVEVVVHPQSVVHSFVEFTDGALLAQLGLPDMRLPIQIALTYPEKSDIQLPRLKPTEIATLTFEEPDPIRFPSLQLARNAAETGGTAPTVLNAANETAVHAFLDGKIGFTGIFELVEGALSAHPVQPLTSEETILFADAEARRWVQAKVEAKVV